MSAELVFMAGAALVIAGSLGVVLARRPVHSALFLVQTLFGVAVLFVNVDAHFLAAVQLIVYAGAIVILFLFVIMLLGVDRAEELGVEPIGGQRPLAVVIGASIAALGFTVVAIGTGVATGKPNPGGLDSSLDSAVSDIERLGRVLFTDYALALEITAALLTIAVIAAVVLTRAVADSDRLDDLEPAPMSLPSSVPAGADDDHSAAHEHSAPDEHSQPARDGRPKSAGAG